jgi:GNAT superfamily N-acetyltransferase
MSQSPITIIEADLTRADHSAAVLELLNAYSMEPMADGAPLAESTRQELIPALQRHPTTLVFLAWRDAEPVGLAICFLGFSTFAARPLVNIHDFFVSPKFRGLGVARQLLAAVENRARELGCCKLTLEVFENNQRAKAVYSAAGFAQSMYSPEGGGALFYSKPL